MSLKVHILLVLSVCFACNGKHEAVSEKGPCNPQVSAGQGVQILAAWMAGVRAVPITSFDSVIATYNGISPSAAAELRHLAQTITRDSVYVSSRAFSGIKAIYASDNWADAPDWDREYIRGLGGAISIYTGIDTGLVEQRIFKLPIRAAVVGGTKVATLDKQEVLTMLTGIAEEIFVNAGIPVTTSAIEAGFEEAMGCYFGGTGMRMLTDMAQDMTVNHPNQEITYAVRVKKVVLTLEYQTHDHVRRVEDIPIGLSLDWVPAFMYP